VIGVRRGGTPERHHRVADEFIDRAAVAADLARHGVEIAREQRDDLIRCLDRVWAQVCAGERYFRQYRQLKMYNDPELNPVLYQEKRAEDRL